MPLLLLLLTAGEAMPTATTRILQGYLPLPQTLAPPPTDTFPENTVADIRHIHHTCIKAPLIEVTENEQSLCSPIIISRVLQSLQIPAIWLRRYPYRGIDSNFVNGTCRQCGSWSVAGHNHRNVIGRDPICSPVGLVCVRHAVQKLDSCIVLQHPNLT